MPISSYGGKEYIILLTDTGLLVAFLYIGGNRYFKQCLIYGEEYLSDCYHHHNDKNSLLLSL